MSAQPEMYPDPTEAVTDNATVPEHEKTPREVWHEKLQNHIKAEGYDIAAPANGIAGRNQLTKTIHEYIHDDLYERKPDELRLPSQLVVHRIDKFYTHFRLLDPDTADTVAARFQNDFQRHQLSFAYAYASKFREVRVAFKAEEDFRTAGHLEASQAVLGLLTAYGMTLRVLQAMNTGLQTND